MAGGSFVGPNGNKAYPGNLTLYVTLTCIVAAMGGLIFGYDIGISGGVTSMDSFLRKFFPEVYREKKDVTSTNQYCKFGSETLTLFMSSLYLAALLSSLVASTVTRKFGRKLSMLFGGILFLAGALLNGFSKAVWMLIVGRILCGFGVGFANQVFWQSGTAPLSQVCFSQKSSLSSPFYVHGFQLQQLRLPIRQLQKGKVCTIVPL
ncbi:hypothetical protein ACH5RR_014997 [Cinchona calisaya]|uniref:Major facilitator superfamily (MFS) profile domain-containing protein n=1 Tax=Cinchona calisaya TaxID=153742 RepID=A0ABD2ZSA6_9GENT